MEKLVFISHEHNEKEINQIGKIRSLAHDMWKKKYIYCGHKLRICSHFALYLIYSVNLNGHFTQKMKNLSCTLMWFQTYTTFFVPKEDILMNVGKQIVLVPIDFHYIL